MSITWGQGDPGPWSPAPEPSDPNAICENIWSRPLANGDVARAMVNQGETASIVCDSACFALAGLGHAKKINVGKQRKPVGHHHWSARNPRRAA